MGRQVGGGGGIGGSLPGAPTPTGTCLQLSLGSEPEDVRRVDSPRSNDRALQLSLGSEPEDVRNYGAVEVARLPLQLSLGSEPEDVRLRHLRLARREPPSIEPRV